LLQDLPPRLVRAGVDHREPDQFAGQQAERPPRPARGRAAARQGNQPGFRRAVQFAVVLPIGRLAVEGGRQARGDVRLAAAGDGGGMDRDGGGDGGIGPARPGLALVGLEPDARVGGAAGGGGAAADERVEVGAGRLG